MPKEKPCSACNKVDCHHRRGGRARASGALRTRAGSFGTQLEAAGNGLLVPAVHEADDVAGFFGGRARAARRAAVRLWKEERGLLVGGLLAAAVVATAIAVGVRP